MNLLKHYFDELQLQLHLQVELHWHSELQLQLQLQSHWHPKEWLFLVSVIFIPFRLNYWGYPLNT